MYQETLTILDAMTQGERLAALTHMWEAIPVPAQCLAILVAMMIPRLSADQVVTDHGLGALLTSWPSLKGADKKAVQCVVRCMTTESQDQQP